jgi:hypothetical protein
LEGAKEKRLDNKGEEKGENPFAGEEHSESLESALLFPRIFFLRLLDKKSSLGVPMLPREKVLPAPSMFEKKLEYDEVEADEVAA